MRNRKSLTVQITTLICALVAGAIVCCWILNSTLLERYYVQNKRDGMIESFYTISTASSKGMLDSSEFDIVFENICSNGNIKTVVISPEGRFVKSSVNDMETMKEELFDLVFHGITGEVVSESDQYQLIRKNDKRLESEYLILVGTLDSGDLIIMRTALESIRVSADISNRFLLQIGLLTIVISIVIGVFIARRITRPILQLTDISKQMVDLNFEAKYVHGGWKKDPRYGWKASWNRRRNSILRDGEFLPGNEIDQLGDHINHLSKTLEETISELKTANVELMRDIEKKTEIDEMRKEFLSNVSHELKTPLAIIQGYAEGLQECIHDDEESRDFYCEVIIDEANKMNGMVKKLLTLNQLESGHDQVVMERFDITELINGVAEASQILAQQQGIQLLVEKRNELFVWGDEYKVEEVVTNYLSNAIHHCTGEKEVRIAYESKEDAVRIRVFNTGAPIPQEDLEQIWEKFYKVDKARTREYGGSGIGLSIVKAIMESMGQSYGVVNHTDGVEFWFELSTK